MYCNQPLWATGFQNNFQSPYKLPLHYPEVTGEGNVISLTLPDGNIQYFFVPINRLDRWTSYNPNIWNIPNPSNANNEAWFIRSIFNPYPPVITSQQQLPNGYGDPFTRPFLNMNKNLTNDQYVQKFHNDVWTSTTDLHYFYPQPQFNWPTRGCAGVQVEIPKEEKTIFHYHTECNRPCYCVPIGDTENQNSKNIESSSSNETSMSVDDMMMNSEIVTECRCCKDEKPSKKTKSNKHPKGKNTNFCVCHLQSNDKTKTKSDKLTTTYADQTSSCTGMKGRETQTVRRKGTERNDIETEVWYPKRAKLKKIINKTSSKRIDGACDSNCYLDTSVFLSDTDPVDKI